MVAASKLSQVFTYDSWVHAMSGAAVSSMHMNFGFMMTIIVQNAFHSRADV